MYVELRPLHLLDVAVETVVLPSGKQHRLSLGNRILNAVEHRFISHGAFGLLLNRRELDFDPLTGLLIEEVVVKTLGFSVFPKALDHALGD